MPCYGGPSDTDIENDTIKELEAMLCGLVRAINDIDTGLLVDLLSNHFNERESGITSEEVAIWIREHCKQDKVRDKNKRTNLEKILDKVF